jgi:type VI secretion system secreted protein Hcp
MWIQFDGIKGEASDGKFKEHSEVLSWSHGLQQAVNRSTSGGGAHATGRVQHTDFTFSKRVDSSTTELMERCNTATVIKKAVFKMNRAMKDKVVFYEYEFSDLIITSISSGASKGEDVPIENISFVYDTIKISYTPTDPDTGGTKGPAVKTSWNLAKNEK